MPWFWWIPILLVGAPIAATVALCVICMVWGCQLCEDQDDVWR